MDTANVFRLLIGVGVIGASAAFVTTLVLRSGAAAPLDATPDPSVSARAASAGIDLSDGSPVEDRDRLVATFEAGDTRDVATVEFRDGVYVDPEDADALVTAYLSAAHEDGSPRLVASAVDGKLQGPFVLLRADGSLRGAGSLRDGSPVGQYIEYHADGSLLARVMAGADSPNGGTLVSEITVGDYEGGEYRRREYSSGRLQWVRDRKGTTFRNAEMPLEEVVGFMLFRDTLFGQDPITTDSRTLPGPPAG